MRFVTLTLLALVSATALGTQKKENPIKQVVTLLGHLRDKIHADGDADQKLYDKSACWAEKTMSRVSTNIKQNQDLIDELEQEIKRREAQKGKTAAEIVHLDKEIAENDAAQASATELRNNEHREWKDMHTETSTQIKQLGSAATMLNGKGMQLSQLHAVAGTVERALRLNKAQLTTSELKAARGFVANPTQFFQSDAKWVEPYSPQSTTIQGILKNMFDEFSRNLQTATQDEADAKHNNQQYMQKKRAEKVDLQNRLLAEKKANAEAQKILADSNLDRSETQKIMKENQAFLATVKQEARARSAEWAERSRLRTEEVTGVKEAIDILNRNATHQPFDFLQTSQGTARQQAYLQLQAAAQATQSLRLAKLATNMNGHFDAVLSAVDNMIQVLRDEEAEDIAERDACQNQESTNTGRAHSLAQEKATLSSNIGKLTLHRTQLQGEVSQVKSDINSTKIDQEAATENRNDENKRFQQHRKDNQEAVLLITKAINVLKRFYKENKVDTALSQEDPDKYTVDENESPDFFKEQYAGRSRESKGIVFILMMIREDAKQALAKGQTDENNSISAYQTLMAETNDDIKSMQVLNADLNRHIADADSDIAHNNGMKTDATTELTAVHQESQALSHSCAWVATNFETRKSKREAEMEGLHHAKSALAGAALPESFSQSSSADDDRGSFLQRRQ